jgi:hypothetical protein
MPNHNLILQDAIKKLHRLEELNEVESKHIKDRYFSAVYEISETKKSRPRKYILKISTTSRSCEKEYKTYLYLMRKKIKCVVPITYSRKYNYLITKKEELSDFKTILINDFKNQRKIIAYLKAIGQTLKKLEIEKKASFNKEKYLDYVLPRLQKSQTFSEDQKQLITKHIQRLTGKMNNQLITNSLVTDLFLENLHFNNDNHFVLLDMGDAEIKNRYQNIALIYLGLKFDAPIKHHKDEEIIERLFKAFLKGYRLHSIRKTEFILYQCKHLINMINFANSHQDLKKYTNSYKDCLLKILGDSKNG